MFISHVNKRNLIAISSICAFLLFGISIPHFLDPENLLNVVRQSSIIGICAVGMTLVIIIKGIDLSVAGIMSFSPMISGMMMISGAGVVPSLLAGLLAGLAAGLFSGFLVAKLTVPAFITTLVVGQICQGLALLMNGGRSIGAFPPEYVFLGNGTFLGIPISDYILIVFLALGFFLQRSTALGSHIKAMGGNEMVLRQEGISIFRIQLFVFGFSGLLTAVSGLLLSAQLDTVHPTQGDAFQLDAIAACIIGGVDLAGGVGSIPMAIVGALVIGCLRNALNLLGIHPFMQNVFIGTIIIMIVFLSGSLRRRSDKATRGTL